MAAYSEMQPAGARANEEKRGETEIWGGDILDTFWWQTFGSRGWSGLKLKDWLIRHSSWKLAPFFSLHCDVTDPYAVHIVLTPKISTSRPFL